MKIHALTVPRFHLIRHDKQSIWCQQLDTFVDLQIYRLEYDFHQLSNNVSSPSAFSTRGKHVAAVVHNSVDIEHSTLDKVAPHLL
jgi:hypothetical protein